MKILLAPEPINVFSLLSKCGNTRNCPLCKKATCFLYGDSAHRRASGELSKLLFEAINLGLHH